MRPQSTLLTVLFQRISAELTIEGSLSVSRDKKAQFTSANVTSATSGWGGKPSPLHHASGRHHNDHAHGTTVPPPQAG